MYFVIWLLALVILGAWTLAAGGLALLLGISGGWLAQFQPVLAQILGLERWWPEWEQAARLTLEVLQSFLAWVGATGPTLVWIAWSLGSALLLLVGAVLSLMVTLITKAITPRLPAPAPKHAPPVAPQEADRSSPSPQATAGDQGQWWR
jgi:hypothetical protein